MDVQVSGLRVKHSFWRHATRKLEAATETDGALQVTAESQEVDGTEVAHV